MLNQLQQRFGGRLPGLIAFDLDGTLVDSAPDLSRAVDRMLAALGRAEAGQEQVLSWVGNGAQMLVKRALASEVEGVEPTRQPEFEAAMELFWQYYGEENGQQSQLYPGVIVVLEALACLPLKLALVTNKPLVFTESLLTQLGVAQYFPLVVAGDSLPQKKPHPLPLQHCSQEFAVASQFCLMVGDSRNDVQAAQGAGWRCAAVTYGYNHGEAVALSKPDWLLDDLRELLL